MRHTKISLICLLFLCLAALVAGCGSTSGSGSTGDFTITATTAVSIEQGQTATFTVTPEASDGFTGSVQVSVSGMPSGVTLSPSSATLTAGKTTTFTLTAAADAAVGTANLVVQGISGNLNARAAVTLTVTAASSTTPPTGNPDFALTASPTTVSITQGLSAQVVLSSTASDGFSGTITVAVNNLPAGVTASPAAITLSPGKPTTVTLTASATATPTTAAQTVSFVGTSGTLSHTVQVQVSVVAAVSTTPDFSLSATPNTITVAQGGQSSTVMVGVTGTNGFSGDVTITASGLPTGVYMIPPSLSDLPAGDLDPIVFEADPDAALGNATVTLTGTSGTLSHKTTIVLTVTAQPPEQFVAVTVAPTSETVYVGSVNTVSVTATATDGYTGPITVTVQGLPTGVVATPATAQLTPGVPQTFTLAATNSATPGESTVSFLAQVNSLNATATLDLTVATPTAHALDVPTWHIHNSRTGLNANETILTSTNVSQETFGRLKAYTTDGAVDAQPLYLSNVTISSATHNVLYAATENDSVYAWDADNGTVLWRASALQSGESAADNQGCNELSSQVGISSTPVIDRNFGTDGAIFFVAKSKDSSGVYHQRLHALDLTTGAELSGSPVNIAAISGKVNSFSPSVGVERAALLLNNGMVYLSWSAPCQESSTKYGGWVMAYDEGTLTQVSTLDLTPDGSGGGIWMSGAGPAADTNGNVYLITSEGTFDTKLNTAGLPTNGDYGNGYVKLAMSNGALGVTDYFEPLNGVPGATNYANQGSGGVILTDPFTYSSYTIPSMLVGAGEDGNIYLLAGGGTALGEYNGSSDKNALTAVGALPHGATSSAAYFNGSFFYGGASASVEEFGIVSGATVSSRSSNTLGSAGATPVISANGTSTAVVWVLDTTASGGPVLYAYSAANLGTAIYSSATNASDAVGQTWMYAVPIITNGDVYVGTQSGVVIYGPTSKTCSAVRSMIANPAVQGWGC